MYRYYDAKGVLLYVGITGAGDKRRSDHALRARWWPLVHRATFAHFKTRAAALASEDAAIRREHPLYNRTDPVAKAAFAHRASGKERGNGEGTVYRVASEKRRRRWCAVVVMGYKPDGKMIRRSRYAETRAAAFQLLAELRAERDAARATA